MTKRKLKRPLPAPETVEELIQANGPWPFIRQVAKQAADEAAQTWLQTLETTLAAYRPILADGREATILNSYIRRLRRRLHVRKPADRERVRELGRERARRYRARRAAGLNNMP